MSSLAAALGQGAYLETRRPVVLRAKPPAGLWDQEPRGREPRRLGQEVDWPVRKEPPEGLTPLMCAGRWLRALAAREVCGAERLRGHGGLALKGGTRSSEPLRGEARACVIAKDEDGLRPLHFAAQAASLEAPPETLTI